MESGLSIAHRESFGTKAQKSQILEPVSQTMARKSGRDAIDLSGGSINDGQISLIMY